jgi:protein farnesyltransferase/geranylgeranyltransferase type-1 subunit alpha
LNELEYVDHLLDGDVRNNSAWNQRYFVIAHTIGFKDDVIERELDYVEKRISNYPDNESSWNYLRGIVRFRSTELNDQRVWKFCEQLYKGPFQQEQLHRQQWRFLLAYMVELLADDEREEKREENKRMIQELGEQLASKIDPIRRKYWRYIQEQHMVK